MYYARHQRTRRLRRASIAMAVALAGLASISLLPGANAIVGGTTVEESFPFIASLQREGKGHFCTGSLISPVWVLTAAHCVEGEDLTQIVIRIGSNDATDGGTLARVKTAVKHPRTDFSLIQLESPVSHQPIPIAEIFASGSRARIIGWGLICRGGPTCGPPQKQLRQLDTTFVDDEECSTGQIKADDELCVTNISGSRAGACFGDSGGPALIPAGLGWAIAGVLSRGATVCGSSPDVYADVTLERKFIAKTIGTGTSGETVGRVDARVGNAPAMQNQTPVPGATANLGGNLGVPSQVNWF